VENLQISDTTRLPDLLGKSAFDHRVFLQNFRYIGLGYGYFTDYNAFSQPMMDHETFTSCKNTDDTPEFTAISMLSSPVPPELHRDLKVTRILQWSAAI
jgi:hypothetical protein